MSDYLTEDDFADCYAPPEEPEDEGFSGVGLLVNEQGEMLLGVIDGGTNTFEAYHISEVEGHCLADMLKALLG